MTEVEELRAEVERLRLLAVPLTDLAQELGIARRSLQQAVLRANEAESEVRRLRGALEREHCAACGNGMGLCSECEKETQPCDACGAEPGEPCRFGCLGYAIEHDELAGTEPCS